MTKLQPFHLAIPVHNLIEARAFYGGLMEFEEGRSSSSWVDYNMYGHQFVIHENKSMKITPAFNSVDGHNVPIPHFGIVLIWSQWENLANRLKGKVQFVIEPYVRFKGEIGEQATMFFLDPSGNALEFKAFKDQTQLFVK
ncbi:MAG: VOC family protein [Flavobacteriales bacterium]|nr:VOC family protein [Flavobacteriales bacterium]